MSTNGTRVRSPTNEITFGDADPTIAALDEIYLDGTLVLVGCGSAKRDPTDPVDVHEATVGPDETFYENGVETSGPAWRAEDLYTSSYFAVKREFAETVTRWGQDRDDGASPWAILSAEHDLLPTWKPVTTYDTTIDDLGDDEANEDHWVENSMGRRRPDGREIVTEMDQWATDVAYGVARWISGYRDRDMNPWENQANTLLVLAGQKYTNALRDRGVFENGIAKMVGDPNSGYTLPVETRFLFEEIDAGGIGEQMAWLSDAVDRLDNKRDDAGRQYDFASFGGDTYECQHCGGSPPDVQLDEYGGEVTCPDCSPDQCARCGGWTHDTGLGSYPLCEDCQTNSGGQKRTPLNPETTEQLGFDVVTDGGDSNE